MRDEERAHREAKSEEREGHDPRLAAPPPRIGQRPGHPRLATLAPNAAKKRAVPARGDLLALAPEEKEELRGILEALSTELESGLASSADAARPVELDQPAVGRVSRIDAIQQQKMLEANRNAQRVRLQAVRAARHRLDETDFGECRTCGEEIALDRLRARPESLYCIDCQSARERR